MTERKGKRPDITLAAKDKETGKRVYWASGWRSERGVNLLLRENVRLIVDGVELTFGRDGTHYLDMFEGEYKPRVPECTITTHADGIAFGQAEPPPFDDDIPF